MRAQIQTPSGAARRGTSRAQFQSFCRTRGNHAFPKARESGVSPSKLVNQPLNRGHSARIFVNPAARATDRPSRRLRYPCTEFKIRLLGALSGWSLISSGVSNFRRISESAAMSCSATCSIAPNADVSENSSPSNSCF